MALPMNKVAPNVELMERGAAGGMDSDIPVVEAIPIAETADGSGESGWAALGKQQEFYVHQHASKLEAVGQLCCPCIEIKNIYDVNDLATKAPLFRIDEDSETFQRACCHPYHGAKLTVTDVRPGAPPNSVVFTATKPFRCFHCCTCIECCTGEVLVDGPNGERVGRTKEAGMCTQLFNPQFTIMDGQDQPYMHARGPCCCFGGCLELCMDTEFKLHEDQNGSRGAEVGKIVKLKPEKDMMQMLTQVATDADNFSIHLPANMTTEQRATALATSIMLDYQFFEAGGMVELKPDGSISCTLCGMFCCGCFSEYKMSCGGNNNDGGA